jgi:uncharacterized protein (TIGR04255 family)
MAKTMTESIVSFSSPPVVEVVAGVAFDGLSPETSVLLAAFWKERLRSRFPILQQQPAYTPPDEQFPSGGRALSFNLIAGPQPARLWAQSSDTHELLQLQPGWFACNWRKVQPSDEYDRWGSRRAAFQHYFSELSEYLASEGTGRPKVRQCEVTYINHIRSSRAWSSHGDFAKIFAGVQPSVTPAAVEQISAQAQFILANDDGAFGRLYTKILPAFDADGQSPLYVFELTARGAPRGDGIDGALTFLDLGREAIDLTFLALTTTAMHAEWGFQS